MNKENISMPSLHHDSDELRRDIILSCLKMAELGFFIGTWGNVSVRIQEGIIVTPTRVDYPQMRPDDLVVVDWEGNRTKGERLATSEMHLHRMVLQARPDLGVVIHTHAPWTTAVACANKSIPVIVEDVAQIIGDEIKCSSYVSGASHIPLAKAAVETLGDKATCALLANHGAVVAGRTLQETLVTAQVLEKAAQSFIFASMLGGAAKIPSESVKDERDRYLNRYGTELDAKT